MELFISGSSEEDALEQGYGEVSGAVVTWLDSEDFVKRCRVAGNSPSDQRWIWLYRAPWSLLAIPSALQAGQRILADWLKGQRAVLKLRHENPEIVLLVNRESTTAQELFTSLGLESLHADKAPSRQQVELSAIFGKIFDWIDPYFWEVFEALEATAWMHKGSRPFFRDCLTPPPLETLQHIMALLDAGRQLPKVEKELADQRQAVNNLRRDLEKNQVSESERNEFKQENELLLLQLRQVQEKFEKSILENREQITVFEEEKKSLNYKAERARQECQILTLQLAELADVEKKSAETLRKMEQTNATLLAEKKNLTERIKKIEEKTAHELKELEEENELLLLQLYQVQEELESYFLSDQQMKATLTQSQHTMDQARLMLCRLARYR